MLLSDTERTHNNLSAFVQVVDNFPIISHHSLSSIPMNWWISSFLSGPFLLLPPFTSSYFVKILQMIEVNSKLLPVSLGQIILKWGGGCYFLELPAFGASLNSLQLSHLWAS